ncbi:MAG: aspartate-semialdehyde dehydrogenase [Gammaproteobacteria bacterium]
MNRLYNVAVLGATGAVGEAMLSILAERSFPLDNIYALASERSEGTRVAFREDELIVQAVDAFDFSKVDIGLFSAGAGTSARYAPAAAAAGCVIIDNTSEFRYNADIPLVVPEVNAETIVQYKARGIIANPNCSTIQMVVALKPIYDVVGIERVNVSTYQAVSGTGRSAITELQDQSSALLNFRPVSCVAYPKQIAFNVLPHIDIFLENGYTKEEMKMVWETKKIMADDEIKVNPTAVRVPVFYGHSEALHIETREFIDADDAREILQSAPGIRVIDERKSGGYPTAVTEAAGTDAVYVGRIRNDISHPRGLNMWVVSDNLRKGAALNSVQIAEILIRDYL